MRTVLEHARSTRLWIALIIPSIGLLVAGVALADTVVSPKRGKVCQASWYGHEFANRKTANGERFNPNALSAAHRSLPLGSRVKVTNLRNGRSVTLRINDRGPYVRPREIDVSLGAARALGFANRGVERVLIEPEL